MAGSRVNIERLNIDLAIRSCSATASAFHARRTTLVNGLCYQADPVQPFHEAGITGKRVFHGVTDSAADGLERIAGRAAMRATRSPYA